MDVSKYRPYEDTLLSSLSSFYSFLLRNSKFKIGSVLARIFDANRNHKEKKKNVGAAVIDGMFFIKCIRTAPSTTFSIISTFHGLT